MTSTDLTGDRARPVSVLFVCTANICRSAFAEQWVRHAWPLGRLAVASAGTSGWVDHPVEEEMAAQLRRRGASAEGFRSRLLTPPMVDEVDLVLTMEASHRRQVVAERPDSVWRVFTLGQLARVLPDVPPSLHGRAVLPALREAHRAPLDTDDVADPYGRGESAAAAAADRIETLLHAIVPRLL